jgi:hypothetical protein
MGALMTDDERDYPSLWLRLCNCTGPQPSLKRHRADEHDRECAYRKEVEGGAQELA